MGFKFFCGMENKYHTLSILTHCLFCLHRQKAAALCRAPAVCSVVTVLVPHPVKVCSSDTNMCEASLLVNVHLDVPTGCGVTKIINLINDRLCTLCN